MDIRRVCGACRGDAWCLVSSSLCQQRLLKALLLLCAADSLQPEALLELLNEEDLRKDTGLPSPEWSSDHIALLAEFRYKPRQRR